MIPRLLWITWTSLSAAQGRSFNLITHSLTFNKRFNLWARYQSMEEHVTHVTYSVIGWDLVGPLIMPISIYDRMKSQSKSENPDSKVHGVNMGPTWGRQDPCRPQVGHVNLASWNISGVWWLQNRLKFYKLDNRASNKRHLRSCVFHSAAFGFWQHSDNEETWPGSTYKGL